MLVPLNPQRLAIECNMIIGVTGSLSTGKSAAAGYLASYLKCRLIDADRIAHLALTKDKTYKLIISAFGRAILDKKGAIDRVKLAEKVFNRRADLKKLCDILHPLVISGIKKSIKDIYKKKGSAFVIVEAPLLIEAGFNKECDRVVVVMASLINQLERAENQKGLKPRDALNRIRAQMPLFEKAGYADYIIGNDGSLKELSEKCGKLARDLKKSKGGR